MSSGSPCFEAVTGLQVSLRLVIIDPCAMGRGGGRKENKGRWAGEWIPQELALAPYTLALLEQRSTISWIDLPRFLFEICDLAALACCAQASISNLVVQPATAW